MSKTRVIKRSEDCLPDPPDVFDPQPGDFVRGLASRVLYLVTEERDLVQVNHNMLPHAPGRWYPAPNWALYEPVTVTIIIEGE